MMISIIAIDTYVLQLKAIHPYSYNDYVISTRLVPLEKSMTRVLIMDSKIRVS